MRDLAWNAVVERLGRWREATGLPGLGFVLVERGGEVRMHCAGARDLATGARFEPTTLFPLCSLSKGFTAAAAAMLVRDGLVGWEDPVTRHLPELRLKDAALGERLSLADLLCHRSGFGNLDLLFSANRTTAAEVIAQLAEADSFDPGQPFLYSNINYLLAGEVVGRVAGRPWNRFVRERIFAPLGMDGAMADSRRYLAASNRAHGYFETLDSGEGRPAAPATRWEPAGFLTFDTAAAAGGIQAPLADLTRWLRHLVDPGRAAAGAPLAEADLERLWSPRVTIAPGVAYGAGFKVGAHRGLRMISQEGNLPGFSASLGLLPEAGIGLALLINATESPLQQRVYREVWDLVLPAASPSLRWPRTARSARALPASPSAPATRGELLPRGPTFPGPADPRDLAQAPLHFRVATDTPAAGEGGAPVFSLYRRGDRLVLDVSGQRPVRLEGPEPAGAYRAESDPSLRPSLLRQPGEPTPHGMVLLHGQRFRGLRVDGRRRPEATAADAAVVTAAARLPGRYRLELLELEVEVRLNDGRPVVEVPGDATYQLYGPTGTGRWLLEPSRLQSLQFHGSGRRRARALTWGVERPVQLERIGLAPPPLTAVELLALRRSCDGPARGESPACLELQGTVTYPFHGLRGEVRWWTASHGRHRFEEDLGRYGSHLLLRCGERLWSRDDFHGQPLRELAGREREAAIDQLLLDAALAGDEAASPALRGLEVLGLEECAGSSCYRAWAEPRRGDPVTCWVCRATGRLLREASGIVSTRFADFREVEGSQIPFLRTTDFAFPVAARRVVEIHTVRSHGAVPPGVFAAPGLIPGPSDSAASSSSPAAASSASRSAPSSGPATERR